MNGSASNGASLVPRYRSTMRTSIPDCSALTILNHRETFNYSDSNRDDTGDSLVFYKSVDFCAVQFNWGKYLCRLGANSGGLATGFSGQRAITGPDTAD